MVYKPGLEPEPGPRLWQAFNLGLAQDLEIPSPPKPGPSQARYITSSGHYFCAIFFHSQKKTKFNSSCRNVPFAVLDNFPRGIFNWVKIEGEKSFDHQAIWRADKKLL